MFKQLSVAIPFVTIVLGSSIAMAADDARSSINITANIPTKKFIVQPRDGEFGKAETLSYNLVTGELSSLRTTFDVKNVDGSVNAYIEGGPAAAALFNGTDRIALTNTFNGVTLTGISQEVVSDAASNSLSWADLVITADRPSDAQSGEYRSSYTVIFDAMTRS